MLSEAVDVDGLLWVESGLCARREEHSTNDVRMRLQAN